MILMMRSQAFAPDTMVDPPPICKFSQNSMSMLVLVVGCVEMSSNLTGHLLSTQKSNLIFSKILLQHM